MINEYFGTLTLDKTYEETGEEIALGSMVMKSVRQTGGHWAMNVRKPAFNTPMHLQSGDRVTIFNTIAKGEILWQGTVALERKREIHTAETGYSQQAVDGFWVHGLQEDLSPHRWSDMFHRRLPAKLSRGGETIDGALDPFFETGTEGVIWSLMDYRQVGYAALHMLRDGDELTIYDHVTEGGILFSGTVPLLAQTCYISYGYAMSDIMSSKPDVLEPEIFTRAFLANNPARISRVIPVAP